MKAARFHGRGKPLTVDDVPRPEIGDGDLLVRIVACGVCRTDLHYTDHGVPTAKPLPVILGHEASGIVEEVGSAVDAFRPGDRVILPAVLSCGVCTLCREGRSNICRDMRMYGNHIDGAFAEFAVAPARQTCRVPDGVPLEEACIIGDAVSTGYHAVVNRGRVREGDRVVVFGCGGIGINVVQNAAAQGAEVLAVDTAPEKLEAARTFGAREVLQSTGGAETPKKVRELTRGGADIAFECIGIPAVIQQAHDSIRRGGRLCIVGYSEDAVPLAAGKIMFLEHEIVGSLGCPFELYPKVLELVAGGRLQVKPLVTGRFPLARINEAFDALRQGKGLRNIVLIGGAK